MRKRSKKRVAAVLLAVALGLSCLSTGGVMVSTAEESGNRVMEHAREAEASDFLHEELEDAPTEIKGYNASSGNVSISEDTNGRSVTRIEGDAFRSDRLTATNKKQTTKTLSQSEIPVYENGILVHSDKIYYGQYDEKQEGVLRVEDAKLKYYADGKFQSAFSGRLSGDEKEGLDYSHVDFYVKNGIVDTSFQGVVTIYNADTGDYSGAHFYVVNGIISGSVFDPDPDDPSASWCSEATGLSIKNTAEGVSVGYDKNRYGDDRGFYIYRLCHETGEFVFLRRQMAIVRDLWIRKWKVIILIPITFGLTVCITCSMGEVISVDL